MNQWSSQQTSNYDRDNVLEPGYLFLFHRIRSKWGIEIPRTAEIREGLYISHCCGVIISGTAS
jgi:serine O-acetyltransferase